MFRFKFLPNIDTCNEIYHYVNEENIQFEKDMSSPYKQLFLEAREILLETEGINEEKKERITSYFYQNSGICHMRTTKNGIDIGLLKGTQVKDKFNLLTGKTKKMRILSFKELDPNILNYYIEESIKIIEK